jgi:hypothetical protein
MASVEARGGYNGEAPWSAAVCRFVTAMAIRWGRRTFSSGVVDGFGSGFEFLSSRGFIGVDVGGRGAVSAALTATPSDLV